MIITQLCNFGGKISIFLPTDSHDKIKSNGLKNRKTLHRANTNFSPGNSTPYLQPRMVWDYSSYAQGGEGGEDEQ